MTDERKTLYLDTNVFIRYLMGEETKEGQQTLVLLSKVQSGEVKVHLLESVFTEIIFVLTKFYNVPRNEVATILTAFIRYKGIISNHKNVLFTALSYFGETNLHIVDCLLAAYAHLNNHELYTFDKQLKDFVASIK